MIRLWRHLIKPIVQAVDARSILEIGAEYGTSTQVLMNYLKQVDGHLHCIDPAPMFSAEEYQAEYEGRLTIYQDLSLNVIPSLPKVDVALVDGDHNWYTVFHELKAIEDLHGNDPLQQPVVFAHDIGFPYGRRDLYYDPATIPEEFLQPYAQKGIKPKNATLVDDGGLNVSLHNAVEEGGPRNGVLTGLEDYLAQSALDYRFINLPLYYGLGILVTEQRIAENPTLATELATLEAMLTGEPLIQLTEHLRVVEGIVLQTLQRKLDASEARVQALEEALAQREDAG